MSEPFLSDNLTDNHKLNGQEVSIAFLKLNYIVKGLMFLFFGIIICILMLYQPVLFSSVFLGVLAQVFLFMIMVFITVWGITNIYAEKIGLGGERSFGYKSYILKEYSKQQLQQKQKSYTFVQLTVILITAIIAGLLLYIKAPALNYPLYFVCYYVIICQ